VEVIPISSAISFSEGLRVDGLLGYDFFTRFVVVIDYAAHRVSAYDPQAYQYRGRGEIIPLEIVRGNILVSASLKIAGRKPIPGKFLVDTGWRSALSLNTPFVEAQRLLATTRTINATTGVGIGGPGIDAVGRIEGLQLGRYGITNPVANFSRDRNGVLSQGD